MMAGENARAKLPRAITIAIVSAGIALGLWSLGWLDRWEAKTWDWRATVMAEPETADDRIVMVLLDQNSLDWAKEENGLSWPWPREMYAAVISFCGRMGAKAIAFDVMFSEPSKYGVADDGAFGDAAAAYERLAAAVFLGNTAGDRFEWPTEIGRPGLRISGLDRWLTDRPEAKVRFQRAIFPISELADSAAILSNVHLDPDPDGVYRRIKPIGVFDSVALPSLGLGTYWAAHRKAKLSIRGRQLNLDGKSVPIDSHLDTLLRYRGPAGTYKNYSAAAVIQSEIRLLSGEAPTISDPTAFKDKYVFFGFSAPGLYDLRSTPVGGIYPGVEIHATLLDNFLSGDFMRNAAPAATAVFCLTAALLAAFAATFVVRPGLNVLACGLCFGLPVAGALAAYAAGFWLPLLVQEIGVAGALMSALVVNYATEGKQKRFIKNAFQQYLSPAVIDELIRNPDKLKLGGERKTLSIFFSDLQGFTSISEKLDPEGLTALLNEYLTAMTDIIQNEGGTVDKYEGDAIIAFWNAPLDVPDHAVRVVRAALRCQERLGELRPVFKKSAGADMHMRVGINTGAAVVGNLGSRTRFDYSMLGDTVNLAARLEGANKQFGTYTMISDATRRQMGEAFAVREIARLAVVGKKQPVTVFEPMLRTAYAERKDCIAAFEHGLAMFYEGRFIDALDIFSGLKEKDPAAAAYTEKCRSLIENPPGHWEGVWVMTQK